MKWNPSGPRADGYASAYHAFMAVLVEFDKPLLAAAKGVGIGIGCTLLFHCDVVYVGESVRLRLPFVSLGLVMRQIIASSEEMFDCAVRGGRQAVGRCFCHAAGVRAWIRCCQFGGVE